jgi:AcrR family transcriptional regulator
VYIVRINVYYVRMTRDRLFAAAKTVLEREGIAGLTIRKVAKRAGMSPMAMYRHFADKDALLNALVEDGLAAWEKVVRSLRAEDPMEWLEELTEAFNDFAAGRSPVITMLTVRIEQARADGRIGDKPALEIALSLSALAQGLVSMHRANRFAGENQFKNLFRTALRHGIESFAAIPSRRIK